ncbi:fatty acid cis/trans isomerase, partial [Vibrio cholerae]|uniref:fatty acid cis/trans isomerase n=1 Tax=Vibrio cholerae TaxID=666 RepID=UPI0015A32F1A
EYTTLLSWLQEGAVMNQALPMSAQEQALVTEYEDLLNHSSRKNQLAARYIYEHLFLSDLYFSEIAQERPRFFKLIR